MAKYIPLREFPSYVVSEDGQVARVITPSGNPMFRVLRQETNSGRPDDCHPYVRPCENGKAKKRYVHQLVAETFLGTRPSGMEAAHKDYDAANNKASNLHYLTPTENRANYLRSDAYRKSQEWQSEHGWRVPKHRAS